jgi:hypothetical protein
MGSMNMLAVTASEDKVKEQTQPIISELLKPLRQPSKSGVFFPHGIWM